MAFFYAAKGRNVRVWGCSESIMAFSNFVVVNFWLDQSIRQPVGSAYSVPRSAPTRGIENGVMRPGIPTFYLTFCRAFGSEIKLSCGPLTQLGRVSAF